MNKFRLFKSTALAILLVEFAKNIIKNHFILASFSILTNIKGHKKGISLGEGGG